MDKLINRMNHLESIMSTINTDDEAINLYIEDMDGILDNIEYILLKHYDMDDGEFQKDKLILQHVITFYLKIKDLSMEELSKKIEK